MNFHLPSFLLGVAVGAAGSQLLTRFRPLLSEITRAGYEAADALWARASTVGEDIEDLLAEAQTKARTRGAAARRARTATRRTASRSRTRRKAAR